MAALITRRALAAGGLAHKLLSLARPAVTAQSRSVSSFWSHVNIQAGRSMDAYSSLIIYPDRDMTPWACDVTRGGGRWLYETWEDAEGIHGRFDLPGLDKDHVKVWTDPRQGLVYVQGDGPKKQGKEFDRADVAVGRKYQVGLVPKPGNKIKKVRWNMSCGVVKVVVQVEKTGLRH